MWLNLYVQIGLIAGGAVALIAGIILSTVYLRRKRNTDEEDSDNGSENDVSPDESADDAKDDEDPDEP